jgi:hypothetical protein
MGEFSDARDLEFNLFDSTKIPFKIKLNKNLPQIAKKRHPKAL